MRTVRIVFAAVLFFAVVATTARAEENEKISTLMFLKVNFTSPNNGGDVVNKNTVFTHWMYKWAGAGFEVNHKPKVNYLDFHFQATLRYGPFYLLGGFMSDSTGADYAKGGMWYIDSFGNGKVKVLFIGTNYFATNKTAVSYFDGVFEPLYAISEKVLVGANLHYVHWWGMDRDWFLAGPILYYQLGKVLQPYVRLTHEWNFQDEKSWEGNAVRFGLKAVF